MEELIRYINNKICNLSALLKKYVDEKIAEVGEGSTAYVDDISAPAMTQTALELSSGETDIVYLTDRTGAKRWAVPNLGFDPDTTPAAADSVIVDAGGRRWYILSQRELSNLQNKLFGFK